MYLQSVKLLLYLAHSVCHRSNGAMSEAPVPKMDYRRRQSLTMNALYGDITAAAASIDAAAASGRRVSLSGTNGLSNSRRGSVMSGRCSGIFRSFVF